MIINYDKNDGLVPAIIQDARSKQVLMLGYMSEESLERTKKEGKVCFYSRSKQRLWTKGEESGNYLELVDMKVDCDGDTLLIQARPKGPGHLRPGEEDHTGSGLQGAWHKGRTNCRGLCRR